MADQSRLEIVIDSRRAEGNLRNVRQGLQGVESTGVRSLGSLRTAALAATGALAAIGLGSGFSSMLTDIRDFQTEMSGLRAVSRASVEEMERLERQARQLGATTAFGANQAAQAQRFLAQGGLEVNQVLGATPQVMRLAQAGALDLAQAADLVTDVMGQMALGVQDIERIGDVLVATGQIATTDVSQLGQALSFAGGQASGFGLSLEETVVALGLISSSGIKASRAGTGLVGVLASLTQASGPQAEILDRHNIALAQLDVEARGVVPVLQTLAEAQLSGAERTALFGREAAGAANALINGLPAYREQLEVMRDVDGTAAAAAKTMTANLAGAIKGLGSAISEANLQLGDSGLSGALSGTITAATGVVQVFNGMQAEWAAANDISAEYVSTLESMATVAQLTATAVGVRLATAVGTATAAKVKDAAASIANARAEAAAAQQVTRRTGAELASARALLSTTRLEVAATRGTNAHTFALQQLSVARTRAITAAGAHTAATNAATAAMGRASVAARGLSGVMALVGGPAGVALLAAAGLFAFREELGLVPSPADRAREALDLLSESITDVNDASLDGAMIQLNAQMFELERQAREAREQLDRINSQSGGAGALGFEGGQTGSRARAEGELGNVNAELGVVRREMERIQALQDGLDNAGEAGDGTADALDRLGTAADDLAAKFKPMLDDDIESILERAGPGARIDKSGQLRDAFGNPLRTMQRDLDRVLKDQVDAFSSEQNLQAGLEAAAERFVGGATEAAAQAWNSITPVGAESAAGSLMATNSQDSAPGLAKPPSLGTMVFKLEGKDGQGGEVTVEGRADDLRRMADVFSGVASAS